MNAKDEMLRNHFEANMLDGEDTFNCGKAMISAEAVLEYLQEYCMLRPTASEDKHPPAEPDQQTALEIILQYYEFTKLPFPVDSKPLDFVKQFKSKPAEHMTPDGKITEPKPHACKCRDGQEGAMTVRRLDEGLFQCPRCNGIIVDKPAPRPLMDEEKLAMALCPILFGLDWEDTVGSTKASCHRHAKNILSKFSPIGLRLPERWDVENEERRDRGLEIIGMAKGFNRCLDEVIKLNTPTTKEGL